MTKPILISAAIHVVFFAVLFLSVQLEKTTELIVETVNIRIINKSVYGRVSGKAIASSPSESRRSVRQKASIPQFQKQSPSADTSALTRFSRFPGENIEIPVIESSLPPRPSVNESVRTESLEAVNPLEGFEYVLARDNALLGGNPNPWSISWANGSDRGILSFPMIDTDEFPQETERLLNVLIRIKVSPQGDVISAEVVPPGSGDIRIDRHMHNAALQLILEPWPVDNGVQEGSLQLIFLDVGR